MKKQAHWDYWVKDITEKEKKAYDKHYKWAEKNLNQPGGKNSFHSIHKNHCWAAIKVVLARPKSCGISTNS